MFFIPHVLVIWNHIFIILYKVFTKEKPPENTQSGIVYSSIIRPSCVLILSIPKTDEGREIPYMIIKTAYYRIQRL